MIPTVLLAMTLAADPAPRLFEMRVYVAAPGKMEALQARFRDHTTKLFVKHGMTLVGFWVPEKEPNKLVYIVSHADRGAADASWKAFRADPDWVAAKSASETGGSLTSSVESTWLTPTDYSPLK